MFHTFSNKDKQPKHEALAHSEFFEALIAREYGRLKQAGHTYLDYTGGNLYAERQIKAHHALLLQNTFGNPHSSNPTSKLATALVDEARQAVLDFFNAGDYYCVFTANASGALHIVGECYPFSKDSALLLLADNHNSVNGIREYSRGKAGPFAYAPIQYEDLNINESRLMEQLNGYPHSKNKLFAFPAQSNVSGVKHDLKWVNTAQEKGWDVLLDAAAFVPSSKLDLESVQPDFVSISFYKIFGYPTGIGCLLVRKDKFNKLVKPWFAGGTVTLVAVQFPHHYLADNHERFENGTLNYLDIPAIKIGLDYINEIGMGRISERVKSLSNQLYSRLQNVTHSNGNELVHLFGPKDRGNCGGTIIMNFFDLNGGRYEYEQVEALSNAQMISIRSGCFCNPGIDEVNYCISNEELSNYFVSRDSSEYKEMLAHLHKMRGATRVSVGIATSQTDIDTYVQFARSFIDKTKD